MHSLQLAADLARHFEKLSLVAYYDPVGLPTIGYGHLLSHEPWVPLWWPDISETEAEDYLRNDIDRSAAAVRRQCPVLLTEGAYAALIDFVFNLGERRFAASTLRRRVINHDPAASDEFTKWVYAKGRRLRGLVLRRQAEASLFEQY